MKKILTVMMLVVSSHTATAQGMSPFGFWNDESVAPGIRHQPYQNNPKNNWEPNIQTTKPTAPSVSSLAGGNRPYIAPREPEMIALPNQEEPGTVIIFNNSFKLVYIIDNQTAYVYPISVGREGFTWQGTQTVSRIQEWPDWTPPAEMRARRPELPKHMSGGIRNPLGAVAIYLGDSLYRIHGTNDPKSIGRAESSGCFRMLNEHAVHLASIVQIGAKVKVLN